MVPFPQPPRAQEPCVSVCPTASQFRSPPCVGHSCPDDGQNARPCCESMHHRGRSPSLPPAPAVCPAVQKSFLSSVASSDLSRTHTGALPTTMPRLSQVCHPGFVCSCHTSSATTSSAYNSATWRAPTPYRLFTAQLEVCTLEPAHPCTPLHV